MIDMAPSLKSVNQTTVDPAAPKRKRKVIEAAEPTDRWPNSSDIHIPDAEDSYPNTTSPLRMQSAEPEPPLNSDQLLQILFSIWKQMENQQTEMIWLREVAAREKEAATRVLTRLLKHIGAQQGSRSSPNAGKKCMGSPVANAYTWTAHSTRSSRCIRSKTYKNNEDSENSLHSRTQKFPRIEDIVDLVQE